MGKFGKKSVVSTDLSRYMLGIVGLAGFGKSTLMYETCAKLFGDDGYMIFDMGMEDGIKAITGAMYERVPNYGVLNEIVTDIVKNKETDYPNLKVVVIDTLDAYFEVVEEYVIKEWNSNHSGDANFIKAKSINSVEGGFGRGMERVIEVAKKAIARLNNAGVGVWWTAHVKEKDVSDLYTGATYTQLTANMSQKYFVSIKNSTDVIGCGYYDRSIEKVEVGDENPVTKKKKHRNAIVSESRKIKFRDDMLIADAKSRFADIVGEIPLDSDAFIKAIQDAIVAAGNANTPKLAVKSEAAPTKAVEVKPEPTKAAVEPEKIPEPIDEDDNEPPFDVEDDGGEQENEFDREKTIADIRAVFADLPKEVKSRIKGVLAGSKLDDASNDVLKQISDIVDAETEIIE